VSTGVRRVAKTRVLEVAADGRWALLECTPAVRDQTEGNVLRVGEDRWVIVGFDVAKVAFVCRRL
jgi:hypothetical protein